jgi:SP family facilitated glucose transporter-like MFS transporter 3
LTSSYTVGGFLGSVSAGGIADKRGRRAAVVYAAWAVIIGGSLMAASLNFSMLVAGRSVLASSHLSMNADGWHRTVIGLGSGAATVIVPLFLGEVAPANIKGSIGTFLLL